MTVNRIRTWYAESWFGVSVKMTRGTTIAAWTLIMGTAFGGLFSTSSLNNEIAHGVRSRDYQLCVQRVEGRNDARAIWIDLYDFVDPDRENPRANELRNHLDDLLPALSVDDCPAP